VHAQVVGFGLDEVNTESPEVLHSVAADDGQLQNRFCALHVCVSDDYGTRLRLPFHVWFECRMVVRTGAATTRASRLHSNDALHRDQRSKGTQC
jgi:hypothetical protein